VLYTRPIILTNLLFYCILSRRELTFFTNSTSHVITSDERLVKSNMTVPSWMRPKRVWLTGVVLLVALALGVSALATGFFNQPLAPRETALYVGGVPGTPLAEQQLAYASGTFNKVIDYPYAQATFQQDNTYLGQAARFGVQVVPAVDITSVPSNARVAAIVTKYCHNPYIGGWLTSDEAPEDSTVPHWHKMLHQLQVRQQLIQRLCPDKPVMGDWYNNPTTYLAQMKTAVDQIMVDYYPYPDQTTSASASHQSYGSIDDTSVVGQALKAAAGNNTWFIDQGFSWQAEMSTANQFDFGPNPGAPDAQWMIYMAQLALQSGARNLAFFSYEYASQTPGQLAQIKLAVNYLKAQPWW
jgi:hypothetical protein